MAAFQRVYNGTLWEAHVGYCRALRTDDRIVVSGTAAVESDGTVTAPGDGYRQALRCLAIIRDALTQLGAGIDRVVRTRMSVTDIDRWKEYGRAHSEVFGEHPPVTTMVEVRRLVHPDMLIEIEAEAVL